MISSTESEFFERTSSCRISQFSGTTANQFGIKKGLSTISCVFGLKDVIIYYHDFSSCFFTCFLNIRAAFDRVSSDKPLSKLVDRGTPSYLGVDFLAELNSSGSFPMGVTFRWALFRGGQFYEGQIFTFWMIVFLG